MATQKKAEEDKKTEYRRKEIMYIRHRIQKTLLDKSGKEPEEDVPLSVSLCLTGQELPLIVENLKKLADFNWITPIFISVPPSTAPSSYRLPSFVSPFHV